MARQPEYKREEWTGSTKQVMFWHYEKSLGRWFNNQAEIQPLVATMKTAGTVVFWGVMAAMAFIMCSYNEKRWVVLLDVTCNPQQVYLYSS